jgi:formate dehydrogenase alpha subunit
VTGLATAFGSGAMTNNIADIDNCKTMLVIGSNTTEQHPVIGTRIRRAVRRGAKLIVADPRAIDLANTLAPNASAGVATLYIRQRPGTDIALLNGLAHIILHSEWSDDEFIAARTEGFDEWRKVIETYTPARVSEITGVAVDDLFTAARLYADNKPATIFYAMGITQHTVGHNNVLAIANLAMLTGNIGKPGAGVDPLRGQNNVQGACDVGALPNFYTGYQRVTDDAAREKFQKAWGVELLPKVGLTVGEMLQAARDGQVKAMWIVGENVAMSDPDSHHVVEALNKLDFLVVSELFLTETAQLADVVLPAASFAEKDGTFTNTERRVQRVRKAIEPIGECRADWEIVCDVARRMVSSSTFQVESNLKPETWNYETAEQIMDELASLTPSYAGITYDRIEAKGLQWPVPNKEHPGTPILHTEKFSRGKGLFSPVEHQEPAETPDKQFPFTLTTGRILQHYHTGGMTRRVPGLEQLAPEERVELNPDDAAKLGVNDGDWLHISSRRGEVEARAWVTDRVGHGVVFMTFHYAEALGNVLTNTAVDPVAKIPELKVCAVKVQKAKR